MNRSAKAALAGALSLGLMTAGTPAFAFVYKTGTYNCPEIWQTSASARGYGTGDIYIKAPGGSSYAFSGTSAYWHVERDSVGKEGSWGVKASRQLDNGKTYAYCNQT